MNDFTYKLIDELTLFRKDLHQNPELSLFESKTAIKIEKYLQAHTTGIVRRIAETGVMITFDSGIEGKSILLRADTDALPIPEINDFAHKSKTPGVSHKCGHDGHTAMMLGVARILSSQPVTSGKVVLLFQPAEEIGKGAEAVLADELFSGLHFDFVFALHNMPGFPSHQIVLKEGVFNANVKSLIIQLHGKTAHAAEPEKGHNPALAMAAILQFSEKLTLNQPESADFFLITPVHMRMGEIAYGISAGEGELHLTIRSWDARLLEEKCAELVTFIMSSCKAYRLQADLEWTQVFYANVNDGDAMSYVRRAAEANNFVMHEMQESFKWGEDFGLFTQKFKGAMFGVGAGMDTPALHNPDYDFPDEIMGTGIQQFVQIIREIMKDG